MRRTSLPEIKEFPEPQMLATWIARRAEQFKTHGSMAHAKNAISGTCNGGLLQSDAYLYEWKEDTGWVQLHHLEKGTAKDASPLFQTVVRKRKEVRPPAQSTLDKTLRSIQQAIQEQQ